MCASIDGWTCRNRAVRAVGDAQSLVKVVLLHVSYN